MLADSRRQRIPSGRTSCLFPLLLFSPVFFFFFLLLVCRLLLLPVFRLFRVFSSLPHVQTSLHPLLPPLFHARRCRRGGARTEPRTASSPAIHVSAQRQSHAHRPLRRMAFERPVFSDPWRRLPAAADQANEQQQQQRQQQRRRRRQYVLRRGGPRGGGSSPLRRPHRPI